MNTITQQSTLKQNSACFNIFNLLSQTNDTDEAVSVVSFILISLGAVVVVIVW